MTTEPTLWVIVGATGTGKSETSLALAEELGRRGRHAEIINADAMQLYRGMDIGTAKLPERERRGIPHHLLDVLAVTEEAAVATYQPAARAAIAEARELMKKLNSAWQSIILGRDSGAVPDVQMATVSFGTQSLGAQVLGAKVDWRMRA